jgi:Cys-tRNA(Pro) deacylase
MIKDRRSGLNEVDVAEHMKRQGIQGRVIPLTAHTETVEAAAIALNVPPQRIVKSLLFIIEKKPVLVISCGTDRIDRRVLASHFGVGRKRVVLADADTVHAVTGYEVGAMPPFGHREKLDVILDRSVLEHKVVYAGGGSKASLLEIAPQEILRMTGAAVLDLRLKDTESP